MPSIFSKIVAGDIPCYKVAENENFLAFLDIFPLAKGHTLVIPKKETDYIFDMESEEYKELWAFAQKVAKAQKKSHPLRTNWGCSNWLRGATCTHSFSTD